jgi:uncharacterized protein (TIGR02996 family)
VRHQGFLQAICETPADDAPRLIYADWLQDQGEHDRAEFIRVQIQRASLDPDDPGQRSLHRREAELLAQHGDAWLAELPALKGVRWGRIGPRSGPVFERGFVAGALVTAVGTLYQRFDAIAAAAPVRWVEVRELNLNVIRALSHWPGLPRLRGLVVRNASFADDLVRGLAESPHAANLEHLDLSHPYPWFWPNEGMLLGPDTLRALAASPCLPALRSLDLTNHGWGQEQVEALANAGGLPRLHRLQLSPVAGELLSDLAAALARSDLRWLAVGGDECNGHQLGTWLTGPVSAKLSRLVLDGYMPDWAAQELTKTLVNAPNLRWLHALDLSHNTDLSVEQLAGSIRLFDLRFLRLGHRTLSGPEREALLNSTILGELRELHLTGMSLDTEFARLLATRRGLPKLELVAAVRVAAGTLRRLRESCPTLEVQAATQWRSPYFWTNPQR